MAKWKCALSRVLFALFVEPVSIFKKKKIDIKSTFEAKLDFDIILNA